MRVTPMTAKKRQNQLMPACNFNCRKESRIAWKISRSFKVYSFIEGTD